MADVILKNNAGKIWVNGAGKVLKAKQFSEIPIQDGLEFWGQADPTLLTIVDGLVSEAYDVRDGYGGARKMIQNTVAYRPILYNDSLVFGTGNILNGSSSARSLFMIAKYPAVPQTGNGIFSAAKGLVHYTGSNNVAYRLIGGSWAIQGSIYKNGTKYINSGFAPGVDYILVSSISDFGGIYNISIGVYHTAGSGGIEIKEWGWYNKVLSETEVVYNINCLNQKYSLF